MGWLLYPSCVARTGNFGCVFEGYYQRDETDEDAWELVAVKTLIDRVTHAIDMKVNFLLMRMTVVVVVIMMMMIIIIIT